MDRRKDTLLRGSKLPRDYLKLVEDIFNKNFAKQLVIEKGAKEKFVVNGELFPDEVLLSISLQAPGKSMRMTTCYASVDHPPVALKNESGKPASSTEAVQHSVNLCVDATASFFNNYFTEGRPLEYDLEYRQGWTPVEIDKNTKVYLRINRDNPDLEAVADAILEQDEHMRKKKKLH